MHSSTDHAVVTGVSLVSVVTIFIGCVLLWRNVEFWTDSENEKHEYNALALGPLLLWLLAALSIWFKVQQETGRALIFNIMAAGLIGHVTVGNQYTSIAFANYARLLLDEAADSDEVKETFSGLVLIYTGCLAIFLASAIPLGPTRKKSYTAINIGVGISALLAIIGAIILFNTVVCSLAAVNPSNVASGVYGTSMAIAVIGLVSVFLLFLGAVLSTTEIVAASVINSAATGIWILGLVFEIQEARQNAVDANILPNKDETDVYVGGIFVWLSCVVGLVVGIAYFQFQAAGVSV